MADTASNTTAAPNTTQPGGKGVTPRDAFLRYPYARIDNESDYLRIQIVKYESADFNLDGLFDSNAKIVTTEDPTTKEKTSTIPGLIKKDANFALPTISDKVEGNIAKENILQTICLPIPEQISDTTQITWGEGTLNPAEAFGVSFANKFQDNPTAALEGALRAFQNLGTGIQNEQARKAIQNALSATAIGALGGNVSANQLISRATGQVFNPNLELLFDGVGLRNFQFNFDFFPRNRVEAEQVVLIIRSLKRRMSAKKNQSGNKTKGVFISAPDLFKLTYMKGSKKHPFLNTFKPMALVDMQVNYTGSNTYSTFYDGMPTHLQMSLSFKELNPIYAEDYEDADGYSTAFNEKVPGVGY
jgi:hypothetical protein